MRLVNEKCGHCGNPQTYLMGFEDETVPVVYNYHGPTQWRKVRYIILFCAKCEKQTKREWEEL